MPWKEAKLLTTNVVVKRQEEYGVLKTDVSELWKSCVKSAKQYIKSDHKVFEN